MLFVNIESESHSLGKTSARLVIRHRRSSQRRNGCGHPPGDWPDNRFRGCSSLPGLSNWTGRVARAGKVSRSCRNCNLPSTRNETGASVAETTLGRGDFASSLTPKMRRTVLQGAASRQRRLHGAGIDDVEPLWTRCWCWPSCGERRDVRFGACAGGHLVS